MSSRFEQPNPPAKKLLSSNIRYECGDAAYDKGRQYYEKGYVLDVIVKNEGTLFTQINSTVQGTGAIPYKQNIRITWSPDFRSTDINGSCTCPMGYNCKHVAAVCLAHQQNGQVSAQPKAPVVPTCLDWLNNLNKLPVKVDDPYQDFLVYILKPSKSAHELNIEFLITKEKKSGGLGKGRKTSLNNLRYSYSYLSFIQPEDAEITKLLSALSVSMLGEPILSGVTGHIALTKMLETGRLFIQDTDHQPLISGEPRALSLEWEALSSNAFQLRVGVEPSAKLILTDPPQYLDALSGTLGLVNIHNLTLAQINSFLTAPQVPPEYAEEFSLRLALEHPELPLPPPKKLELTELDNIPPVPSLYLFGSQLLPNLPYSHFMQVNFLYDDNEVNAFGSEEFSIVKTDNGLVRIKRDQDTERTAITQLVNLGFDQIPQSPSTKKELVLFSAGNSPLETTERWRQFLQDTLPELKQQGWECTIDDNFLLNFQSAQNWDAEIDEGQNDWFEMRFTVEVNGQALPLLPLLMPILEHYDPENLPDILNIPLVDHSYLYLPSEKIKPFLAILMELFNTSSLDKNGNLKMSRFNVASLADLESHSYGLFSIRGGKSLRELAQKIQNFSGIEHTNLPENFTATLRNYQQDGLNWLQFLREYQFGGILADDMGLGKTIQTLAHLLLEKQSGRMTSPCLIIAPTSLMSNWRREAERFTPELKVLILQGADRHQLFDQINTHDLVLTTYPLLPRDEDTLLEHKYHYLILDEAQTVKNPLAKAAQVVRRINASHRLCLTGTPMENHLGELWTQFDFLMPGFLGDNANFKKLYRTPIELHGDNAQRSRLIRRIAPFMLRRTKSEVATELPAKTEIIRSVPLYEKQAALYESIRLTMEKKVRDAIAEKGLARSHITILDALLKLRQTCCDPRTLALKEAQKIHQSAKLDLLMEMLPEQLEEGRRILVFSAFTRMITLIEEELTKRQIGYTKLTGQTRKRDEAIELFKSGAVDVFLISLKAGGVGLNLTEADTVIIYDPWWNPAAESQATDRAHRIGQDKPVFVYKLITENTVEEKILAMQERKRALANGIYGEGDKEEGLKLTAEDLTALFDPL